MLLVIQITFLINKNLLFIVENLKNLFRIQIQIKANAQYFHSA